MLASHRKINEVQAYEIDLAYNYGLKQKSTFQLMSTHAEHRANLRYTLLDVKNYLNARRQRNMVYGEAGCLLQYFQQQLLDNLSFFHAYHTWCWIMGTLVTLFHWIPHIVLIAQIDCLLCFLVSTTIGVC